METIKIKGKEFDKEEVEQRGKTKVKIISNVFRWVGLGIFITGLIPLIVIFLPSVNAAQAYALGYLVGFLLVPVIAPHIILGFVFFCVSFKKRNAMQYGIKDIEKELPDPENTVVVNVNGAEISARPMQPDKFEEIKKYKELLDNGIITQEEFDQKKSELL